jgi:hypothetical protein
MTIKAFTNRQKHDPSTLRAYRAMTSRSTRNIRRALRDPDMEPFWSWR